MHTEIMVTVPENPGLKIKAHMSMIWVNMPAVQANVNQNQGVCYHKQLIKTRSVCLEPGLRCLKSRYMRTEIRASVPENPGLKIKAIIPIIWMSIPEIQVTLPRNNIRVSVVTYRFLKQGQCAWNQSRDARNQGKSAQTSWPL